MAGYVGGANGDYWKGTTGADTADGGAGDDTLKGADGNDRLTGGDGADKLYGGLGDDYLYGGPGPGDLMDGGAGRNAGIWLGAAGDWTIDLAAGSASTGGQLMAQLISIQDVYASAGNDRITGLASAATSLHGDAGDDTLLGGTANDFLEGQAGNDVIHDAGGSNAAFGWEGDDIIDLSASSAGEDNTLSGGTGSDSMVGGAGADFLRDEDGDDTLIGGGGDDVIAPGYGANHIDGGAGKDTLDYSSYIHFVTVNLANGTATADYLSDTLSGIEVVYGTYTADTMGGGFSNCTLFGGDGNDQLSGGLHNDSLDGGGDNDTLRGGEGSDRLSGGTGNDILFGGNQSLSKIHYTDSLDGGAGNDTADYSSRTAAGVFDLKQGTITYGAIVYANLASIETVLAGSGNDQLNTGKDGGYMRGGAGDDTLKGGLGADALFGDDDSDKITDAGGFNTLDGSNGDDVILALGTNAQSQIYGGGGNDTLTATGGGYIWGGLDNDLIHGGLYMGFMDGQAGDDTIIGGANRDVILGGSGTNILDGGGGQNAISYENFTDSVTVRLLDGLGVGAGLTDHFTHFIDIYGSIHSDVLIGDNRANQIFDRQGGDDSLNGGGGDDTLMGGSAFAGETGDDTLRGDAGNDTLIGGGGANLIDGGKGVDWANYNDGDAIVFDPAHHTVTHSGATDTLVSVEWVRGSQGSDTLVGSRAADRFDGNYGNDVLNGGKGNDTLIGGGGGDLIRGGAGADHFVYRAGDSYPDTGGTTVVADPADPLAAPMPAGLDRIFDLEAQDVIDLSLIDADYNTGNGDTAFKLVAKSHHQIGEAVMSYHTAGTYAGKTTLELYTYDAYSPSSIIVIEGDHHTFNNFVL